jgi:pimeloyl-ACP methyl ester carboxylesterase
MRALVMVCVVVWLAEATFAQRKAGEVVFESASVTAPETGAVEFELGTLFVRENRADPKSRVIGVGFARFRATKQTGAPPTFHLPGGPGNSFLTELKQTASLPRLLPYINRYRAISDVILVDQRGNSERGEVLTFRYRTPELPLDQPASVARSTAAAIDRANAAVAEYKAKPADLSAYTIFEFADDVNDLRQALGYKQITLVGTSFGSQWSFAVMRRHPTTVARALLSGVEPLDGGYDMPSHVVSAVQRMFWEAEKDPRWHPYLPPGGLMTATRTVMRRLAQEPVRVDVKDAKTGEVTSIVLGVEDFQRDFVANVPRLVISLYYEQYEEWARTALAGRRSRDAELLLITNLVDTSLGVTPRREFLLKTDPGIEFTGTWGFASYLATAPIWPTADVGDEFRTEITNNIPVVFAQGDWDTQTPVENVLQVSPYFPNSRVLIVVNGGHGVLEPLAAQSPEAFGTLMEFVQTGTLAKIPSRVTLPAPRFAPPAFPPPSKK